jgi:ABC-type multidrug transport system ATPase subunit
LSIILGLKKLDKGSIFTNKEFIDNKKDYLPRPPAIFACSVNWNALFSDDDFGKYNDVIRKYDFSEVFEKNYKDDYVYDKISGGEKSKTVFIRSEIIDAPFIIFDEPEAWLDSGQKRLLVERIKYLREKEKTVLIATHDKEIVSLCTKKVEIKNDMAVYYDEII